MLGACTVFDDAADSMAEGFYPAADRSGQPAAAATLYRMAPGAVDDDTTRLGAALCPRAADAVRRDRADVARMAPIGVIAGNIALTAGTIALSEAITRAEGALERRSQAFTSRTEVVGNLMRSTIAAGETCFLVTRRAPPVPGAATDTGVLLWAAAFSLRPISVATVDGHQAFVLAAGRAAVQGAAAAALAPPKVTLQLGVIIGVQGRDAAGNATMRIAGSGDFSTGPIALDGTPVPLPLRPGEGPILLLPRGEAPLSVAVTAMESGSGLERLTDAREVVARHRAAVEELARSIAADRLGLTPLPGR